MCLLEDIVDPSNPHFDLLYWGKGIFDKFPILSLMACDMFAISVSIVVSKFAFDTENHISNPVCSSLTPRVVESLVCAQNWLCTNKVFIQNWEIVEEISIYEVLDSGKYWIISFANTHTHTHMT